MNIIKEFLKTNAFLYTPYNKSVVDKLKSTISGAGSGDSPVLRLMGEKNKDNILNLTAEVDLHSLVKSLSKSQKEELASLLDELD